MRKYLAFFKMNFIKTLQYRTAALAGIITQFLWGALSILLYKAFYDSNPSAFPMDFQAFSSYIWLRQSLLALYHIWYMESEIMQMISNGNISYELCRPTDLYHMWFSRTLAKRLASVCLRFFPVILVASFLPKPYGIVLPHSLKAILLFIISSIFSVILVVAFTMLIYISVFYILNPLGIRLLIVALTEILTGTIIPLPFLPDKLQFVIELLPFASMENLPFRIYSGDISGYEAYARIALQAFWVFAFLWFGKKLMTNALKKVVVQGG